MYINENIRNVGIYKIINIVINDSYIGSSAQLERRGRYHLRNLRENKHPNRHLQNSWNKCGEGNFVWQILFYCEKKDLKACEDFVIKNLNTINKGFNVYPAVITGKQYQEIVKKKIKTKNKL